MHEHTIVWRYVEVVYSRGSKVKLEALKNGDDFPLTVTHCQAKQGQIDPACDTRLLRVSESGCFKRSTLLMPGHLA